MSSASSYQPQPVQQVMVSSTFTDLQDHRTALIDSLNRYHLHPRVMEHDSAKLVDVIESSLAMVRDSAAYIGVIGLKYGQTPECPTRNPGKLSITELEFNEAQRLGRPVLLFVMGDEHPVKKGDIEKDPEKDRKLNAFRERAKKFAPDSSVNRVYAVFNSLQEFKDKIGTSLTDLCKHLQSGTGQRNTETSRSKPDHEIPIPPAFYAAPDYIGRTQFIGRKAQLQLLNAWAQPTDKNNVLLFEAIGGNGKSMLTWHWAKDEAGEHATICRPANSPWAGRFWYSFYEKGAVMRQFCQHALAYITQQPLETFEKKSTPEMRELLMAELHKKPWLLILDGLERVLVAYHRIDAAEVRDEDLNRPTDKILNRDPCDTIRDEDADLLRAFATAAPSKILISSRLIPRALLAPSGLPLPRVRPLSLPGLDAADAEELLRFCGVRGTSADIRYYLTNYCGNHPLVIGVLAGLINAPGPHRGNFDAWAADPAYGAKLNLASLDLIQSRNHILRAALEALEPASRQLLCTLALLSSAVDYETVAAFNPHMPPEPEEVEEPMRLEDHEHWKGATKKTKAKLRHAHETAVAERRAYERAFREWRDSDAVRSAPQKLDATIADLEHRGLLQYDPREHRYDLHPVVRGVAAGTLKADETERYGQMVVDHFNAQAHSPYGQATTIDDVENDVHIVRTLIKLGRFQQAASAYLGGLSISLSFNLEAHVETLALLRPLFPGGWNKLPSDLSAGDASSLVNHAGIAFHGLGKSAQAVESFCAALRECLEREAWSELMGILSNICTTQIEQSRFAHAARVLTLTLELARITKFNKYMFLGLVDRFGLQSLIGDRPGAEAAWQALDPMGRRWNRGAYRQGTAEYDFARSKFWQGHLQEEHLSTAAILAAEDKNRKTLRDLHELRGAWRLEQREWALAAASFTQAVTMAREARLADAVSESGLALAKVHLGALSGDDARGEAERLAQLRNPSHRFLSLLWQAIGDLEKAKHHALAAYTWAWADGEPYVHRYELTKTTELLRELGVAIPNLPVYDPAKDEPFPWEADVRAAIEKLRAKTDQPFPWGADVLAAIEKIRAKTAAKRKDEESD